MSKQSSLLSFFGGKRSSTETKPERDSIGSSVEPAPPKIVTQSPAPPSKLTRPSLPSSEEESPVYQKKRLRKAVLSDSEDDKPILSAKTSDIFSFGASSQEFAMPVEQRRSILGDDEKSKEGSGLTPEEISSISRQCGDPFWFEYVCAYFENLDRFDFASFLDPRTLKDSKGRKPSDSDFDISTLLISRFKGKLGEEGHATPMLQQFWEVKSEHFSDIVLFKVGKFYEIFYVDACIAQRVCGLKWMGNDRRAHVGFPEQALHTHAKSLIEAGFKAVVVEQTETVEEAMQREGKQSALVQRGVCEVYTKGTLIHDAMLGENMKSSNVLMAIMTIDKMIGLCIVDCAGGLIKVGMICKDNDLSNLRTILTQYLPKEVLLSADTSPDIIRMIRAMPSAPLMTSWARWNDSSIETIERSLGRSHIHAVERSVINGVISYLAHLKLEDSVTRTAQWRNLSDTSSNKLLSLDAAALVQLEILRTSSGTSTGSLLNYLDHCVTGFGSRKLHNWVCSPLFVPSEISGRQQAISWLLANGGICNELRDRLGKLPDMERRVQKICSLAQQGSRRAVFFTDIEQQRMGLFVETLEGLKKLVNLLGFLSERTSSNSGRLIDLIADSTVVGLVESLLKKLTKNNKCIKKEK